MQNMSVSPCCKWFSLFRHYHISVLDKQVEHGLTTNSNSWWTGTQQPLDVVRLNEQRRCIVLTLRSSLMWRAAVFSSHVAKENTADYCWLVLGTNCQHAHIQHPAPNVLWKIIWAMLTRVTAAKSYQEARALPAVRSRWWFLIHRFFFFPQRSVE